MINQIFPILAQAAPAPGGPAASPGLSMLLYMVCFGVIFYFMLIRPQRLKQKEHDKLISGLKTGDKVVTSGGIHGLISNVKEKTVIVKIADNVKIEVDKPAISVVAKSPETPANNK